MTQKYNVAARGLTHITSRFSLSAHPTPIEFSHKGSSYKAVGHRLPSVLAVPCTRTPAPIPINNMMALIAKMVAGSTSKHLPVHGHCHPPAPAHYTEHGAVVNAVTLLGISPPQADTPLPSPAASAVSPPVPSTPRPPLPPPWLSTTLSLRQTACCAEVEEVAVDFGGRSVWLLPPHTSPWPRPLPVRILTQDVGNPRGSGKAGSSGSGVSEGWQRRGSNLIEETRPCRTGVVVLASRASPLRLAFPFSAAVGAAPSTITTLLRGTSRQLFVDRHRGSDDITTLV